jgi:AbiV family abortive infection protein
MDERNKNAYERSLVACVDNGDRLLRDAQFLFDWDSFASSVALSVLAEEEFAKAFLLYLISEGVIPWTTEVGRSLRDHHSKHLLGLVIDWFSSLLGEWFEESLRWHERQQSPVLAEQGRVSPWPSEVAHAFNLYRFERLENWRAGYRAYTVKEDFPETLGTVQKVMAHDGKKQNAIYVRVGSDGQCAGTPQNDVSMEMAKEELARAKRFSQFAGDYLRSSGGLRLYSPEYQGLAEVLRIIFGVVDYESPGVGIHTVSAE